MSKNAWVSTRFPARLSAARGVGRERTSYRSNLKKIERSTNAANAGMSSR